MVVFGVLIASFLLCYSLVRQAKQSLVKKSILGAYGLKVCSLVLFFWLLSIEPHHVLRNSAIYLGATTLMLIGYLVARRKKLR